MTTFISMLRGINVGGQKKIKMDALSALYESLGCKKVKTYIQSGNVVFDSSLAEPGTLSGMIAGKINETFGFPVNVIIRTTPEMQEIVKNNPFLNDKDIDTGKLHVTFMSTHPAESALNKIKTFKDECDVFAIIGKEVYLFCPNGYGNTKLSNNFFEKKLEVMATTRNWKTVNILLEMAKSNSN